MTLAELHNFHTKSAVFVQAFPQAKVKSTIFLKTPDGVEFKHGDEVVLKLIKNLYGLNDAGLTWYEHLCEGLRHMNFKSTLSDPFIFTRGNSIIIIYVDDCCIISESEEECKRIYNELEQKGFKMTDEENME